MNENPFAEQNESCKLKTKMTEKIPSLATIYYKQN